MLEIPLLHKLNGIGLTRGFQFFVDFILVITTIFFMLYPKEKDITRLNLTNDNILLSASLNLMVVTSWVKLLDLFKFNRFTRATSQYFYFVIYQLKYYLVIMFVIIIGFSLFELMNSPITAREEAKFQRFVRTMFE